jgi:hypothetical protein
MSYDFATYVIQQFSPVEQRIEQRIQQEIQRRTRERGVRRLGKSQTEQIQRDIVAKEAWDFAGQTTGGDLRMAELMLSLLQMHYKGRKEYEEGIRQAWMKGAIPSLASSRRMRLLADITSTEKRLREMLPNLPRYSWYISLPVRMAEPFTSKDDSEMHVLENPVCRERVFGVPMVRSTTWKGNLRWMAVMAGLEQEGRERLFGNETDEEEEFCAGRLLFFSTYFDRIDFEVLTPLDRERRFPKPGPILLECVRHHPDDRAKAGQFSLLYLAPPSAWQTPAETISQVASDLKQTTTILTEMLLSYGFSAKKTSGFGVVEDDFRDDQGGKRGMLALVGISLPEAPRGEPISLPVARLLFANCAEMRSQAQLLARALEEENHE